MGILPTPQRRLGEKLTDVVSAISRLHAEKHGALLMPSSYSAMLDLCDMIQGVGDVASMLGPVWALHQPIDWVTAVALENPQTRAFYGPVLSTHINKNEALLEVHTTFPSIGAGGADWVLAVREVLIKWESFHPGFKAELSGGASEAADTRNLVVVSMGRYLLTIVSLITLVVGLTFRSILLPIRLAIALFFTLAATYGVGVVVYQTPLLHGIFPSLAYFDGICYEVIPVATGVAIALGLDYDIFLISRILEYSIYGLSDRASIFKGVAQTGGVISGAGVIMSLAFSGLIFAEKLFLHQFGVLLVVSVLFDTFVVRTILV